MKKSWVDKQNALIKQELLEIEKEIRCKLKACELLDEEDIFLILNDLKQTAKIPLGTLYFPNELWDKYIGFYKQNCPDYHAENFSAFYLKVNSLLKELPTEKYLILARKNYDIYLDSEPMEFDGDILITDPCYIMKQEVIDYSSIPSWWDYVTKYRTEIKNGTTYRYPPTHEDYPDYRTKTLADYATDEESQTQAKRELKLKPMFSPTLQAEWDAYHKAKEQWDNDNMDDWQRCDYGDNMEILGINHYMTRDTIYGDWSCTVFDNSDTKERKKPIGRFCADAGLVSVLSLEEVLKYNPEYKVEDDSWSATVIRDFKGTVQFVVNKSENATYEYFQVEIIGKGVNKKTGENINFISKQTGL